MLSHENLSFILYRVQFILCRVNVLKSASLCFYFSHHSSLRMFRLFYRFYGTILFSMTAASQVIFNHSPPKKLLYYIVVFLCCQAVLQSFFWFCFFYFGGATQTWTGGEGVADPCLTTWLWRLIKLERKTRFELATLALARRCSTTEPLPLMVVPKGGIEPPTRGFSVLCSTDWAIWAYK